MNYGVDYDLGALQEIQESPCKKFKGALATLFENQEPKKEEPKKEEPKKEDNKRKAEDTEEKEAKKPKKDEPKKEDTEEVKKEDQEDSAIIAKNVTAEDFTLKFQDGNLSIHAKTAAAGNKKVPPGSLLLLVRDGGMKKVDSLNGGVLYQLDPKTLVMIAPNEKGGPMGLGGKPLTLTEVVEKLFIKIIDEVPEFVSAGQLPAKITTSHKYWFIPKDCFFLICVRIRTIYNNMFHMGRGLARPHIYIYIYCFLTT